MAWSDGLSRAHRVVAVACGCLLGLVAAVAAGRPANDPLQRTVERIARASGGTVGVAMMDLGTREAFLFNGHARFPMQSTYKFPLAMAVLERVDRGTLSLAQTVHVTPGDLQRDTYSPLRDRHPEGAFDLSLADLLRVTVAESDNNGCDILFRLVGGPSAVHRSIRQLGVRAMAIAATEAEMHAKHDSQFRNWSEPAGMLQLLDIFFAGKTQSAASRAFLWQAMVESPTGPKRLKGLLPPGTEVAHKTGTSFTENGVTEATNDVGIVSLPGGRHLAIVVFITHSWAPEDVRERTIAEIARAGYDYFAARR